MVRRHAKAAAKAPRPGADRSPPRGQVRERWEAVLVAALWVGAALVLLTPLVVTPSTVFPLIVGKAVWSRSLIGIVFALWVVLMLWRPRWRPPRSRLLLLLGAGLAVSLLAAIFGVNFTRSMWADYQRMAGVVDHAHWFAFIVVLAALLRENRDFVRLVNLQVAVGAASAVVALLSFRGVEFPWIGSLPMFAAPLPRVSAPLGNPIFLGNYLTVAAVLALGLLARSFAAATPPRPPGPSPAPAPEDPQPSAVRLWTERAWWGAAALLAVAGVVVSASFVSVIALAVGCAFLLACFGRRLSVRRALPVTAVAGGLLLMMLALPGPSGWFSNPLMNRLADARPAIEGALSPRVRAWQAGLEGFAERPILGFGPENYIVPFGRYATTVMNERERHDYAHNAVIDEAVARGALGLLTYFALWGFVFWTLRRAIRSLTGKERILALFVGSALIVFFLQLQTLFMTASHWLHFALLAAFVVRLEAMNRSRPARRNPTPSAAGNLGRAAIAAAALVLAGAGLWTNRRIYIAATEVGRVFVTEDSASHFERAIRGFGPLANYPRRLLIWQLAERWKALGAGSGRLQLLAWAEHEAEAALRTDPRGWELHHDLAYLYQEVAATEPAYGERAKRQLVRARELSPNRNPFRVMDMPR